MANKRQTIFAAIFLVLGGSAGFAAAAERAWVGGTGLLASEAGNWRGGVPVSGDAVVFGAGSNAEWDLSGAVPGTLSSAGILKLRSPLSVAGELRLDGGKLSLNAQPMQIGSFRMAGGILEGGSSPITVSGNWNVSGGSADLDASTVTFAGSGPSVIVSGGGHFGNMVVNSAGGASVGDDLAVNGDLTLSRGNFSVDGHSLTVLGSLAIGGGSLSLSSGGSLIFAGTSGMPLKISEGELKADPGTAVRYSSISGSIAVAPGTYGNLAFDGAGSFSLSGDVSVSGKLTVGNKASLFLNGRRLDVMGGVENAGTIGDGAILSPAARFAVLGSGGEELGSVNAATGTVIFEVRDGDLNRKAGSAEAVEGAVTVTTVGGDRENLRLAETGLATGIFLTAPIVVHQGAPRDQNGQIEIGQNDVVLAKYVDPQDPSDVKSLSLSAALPSGNSSGAPQIIAPVSVGRFAYAGEDTGSYQVHVTWTTDKPSSSSVSVSSSQLTAPIAAGSLEGTLSHDVLVTGLKRGIRYSVAASSMSAEGKSVTSAPLEFTVIVSGDRIKTAKSSAVYWYLNEKRNVFADFTAYDSWFPDWKGVVTIPDAQMSALPLGKAVPIRAGTYLVKIQSDPKVYSLEPLGKLRWVPTEEIALALYGAKWQGRVRDVDVSQFANYSMGEPLAAGKAPDCFYYKSGGEFFAVVGPSSRQLQRASTEANRLYSRFMSEVAPNAVSGLGSASPVLGYVPELNRVFEDGGTAVLSPVTAN